MIYNLWTNCFILTLTFTLVGNLVAQEKAMFSFGNGIEVVAPDSSISLKFNFNLQNRLDVKTHSTDDWEVDEFSARIRRFRLKFTGFVLDPRITYKIQLAMAPRNNSNTTLGQAPRVMYDAMFSYRVNDRFTIGFGQTALPGNRQRMNSSTALQMVDRSRANSTYNLDLDFGFHGQYKINPGARRPLVFHGAITTGEGQNWVIVDKAGFSYTGRLDWYPLGAFLGNSEYKESDLEWHPEPRLMAGIAYNFNDDAQRASGQRGSLLNDYRDITTLFTDIILKYQGWSVQGAYIVRDSDNPITNEQGGNGFSYVHNGDGLNFQIGKYFRSKWEVVGQLTYVTPDEEIENVASKRRDWTVGLNRYLHGRAVKIQADFTLFQSRTPGNDFTDQVGASFQAQIGI